jgi:hypothetical protein
MPSGPQSPLDCARTMQFFCDAPDGSCRCDPAAPTGPTSCPAPHEFVCDATEPYLIGCRCDPARLDPAACPDPTQWRCEGPDGLDCRCEASAPADPLDCVHPAQFQCAFWQPIPAGCWCDPDAPTDREDCDTGRGEYLSCQSYDPPVGCMCFCCVIL